MSTLPPLDLWPHDVADSTVADGGAPEIPLSVVDLVPSEYCGDEYVFVCDENEMEVDSEMLFDFADVFDMIYDLIRVD